jgi:hypothetical protein
VLREAHGPALVRPRCRHGRALGERAALDELDRHNPLLFDFVLKRTLAVRDAKGEHRFSPEVFTARGVFPRLRAPV